MALRGMRANEIVVEGLLQIFDGFSMVGTEEFGVFLIVSC
jgi:hypothetical protein